MDKEPVKPASYHIANLKAEVKALKKQRDRLQKFLNDAIAITSKNSPEAILDILKNYAKESVTAFGAGLQGQLGCVCKPPYIGPVGTFCPNCGGRFEMQSDSINYKDP